jgi:hypothetical protein
VSTYLPFPSFLSHDFSCQMLPPDTMSPLTAPRPLPSLTHTMPVLFPLQLPLSIKVAGEGAARLTAQEVLPPLPATPATSSPQGHRLTTALGPTVALNLVVGEASDQGS